MKNIPLALHGLSEQDIDWLVTAAQRQKVATGNFLIQEGQIIKTLYIVVEGKFSLSVASSEGETQEVAQLSNGEILGEMSFIDSHPSYINAQALERSEVLAISQQKLTAKLHTDKGFASRWYPALAILLSNRLRGISELLARSTVVPGQPLRKVLLVFSELLDSDIEWMSYAGRGLRVGDYTVLLQQGQPPTALYILLEGTLAVSLAITQDGTNVNKEIAKLASGEIVGEMSLLDGSPVSATVTAAEASVVLSLPKPELTTKLQQDLGFAARFYRAIAIVVYDRLRDRLIQRGYSRQAHEEGQALMADVEYGDELDMELLDNVSLAGVRFDWLVRRIRAI